MIKAKPNPLRDLLDPGMNSPPLAEFDWLASGVSRKFLIIFTGRTGSTLLTKLIKSADLCSPPEEYLSNHYVSSVLKKHGAMSTEEYLKFLARRFTKKGIFGIEIDSMRLRFLHELIEFEKVFSPNDTNYIWLTRRDIVAQAYSFATAMNSGLWHSIEGQPEVRSDYKGQVEKLVDDAQILRQILSIAREEAYTIAFFKRMGIVPFALDYEELISDKPLALMRVLDHVGALSEEFSLEGLSANPTKQMSYDDKSNFIMGFERRNRDLALYLRNNREALDTDSINLLISKSKAMTA